MAETRPSLGAMSGEFALLVDAVQDYAIFILSPEGEIRSWNHGAARIMGYDADEIIGKHFRTFYGKEDRENRKPEHELSVAAAEGRIEDEGWRIRKDGTKFWANTVITALHRPDKSLLGFAKVTRDMTERRAAAERLRQSEELFRLLVSSVKDYAIFMLDANGNVATWNEGAHRIKGYEPSEIIGKHFSTFYSEEDNRNGKPARELEIAQKEGSVEDFGWRIRKDGTRFWANVVITAVYDSNHVLRGFAKVTRDITERKQAEEMRSALLQQQEARLHAEDERRRAEASYIAAQEANRAKDEFLMTLSHELRTPMTAILGWSRLLPSISPNDAMFKEAVASIDRSAQLQARLIDDVLDVSRIVSGKLRLSREKISIEQLLRTSVDAVRPMADSRSITIATSFAPNLGDLIADPARLQQVIWNLLTNAAKFTRVGGTIEVSARRTSSHLEVSVKDNGEGIEPSFLPHVFEPFRQAESPRTRVHGGLGLGLSIVRYLVEAHGGTVSAESPGRGKGSTFSFSLPIAVAATMPVEHLQSAELMPPHKRVDRERLANLQLLVVDDDRETRDYVRAVLRQAGANVEAVDSAQAGLASVEKREPDVVVTDVAMPEMDGFEFTRLLRAGKSSKNMKIVALSAFPAAAMQMTETGLDQYLTKPIDPSELVEAIAKVAGRSQ